jgi:hypothetical protein
MDVRKRPPFSFEKLLKPYEECGVPHNPSKRTLGLQIDWLVNKKTYPMDVVGGALLIVYNKLYNEKIAFKGDGTFGYPGHQLDRYLVGVCEELYRKRLEYDVGTAMIERLLVEQVANLIQMTLFQRFCFWLNKKSENTGHWL